MTNGDKIRRVMAQGRSAHITREQVEKMRGEWSWCTQNKYRCKGCNNKTHVDEVMEEPIYHFCPNCGRPMDDEGVDILWKRLEAMQDEAETD